MDLPIFGNPTLPLDLMEVAGVADDDDETRAAEAERFDAKAALGQARQAYTRAARVGPAFPPEDLARIRARVSSAERDADRLITRLRDQADERLRRARAQRGKALQDFLARPAEVDSVSHRLDQADRLRRLEALDPETRAVMLRDAARQGAEPELLRAALTSPVPPFSTWEGRETPPARLKVTPISLADASRVPEPGQASASRSGTRPSL